MKKIILFLLICSTSLFAQQGAIDTSFNLFTGANGAVTTTLTLPDGKIIIGGAFTQVNGTTSNRIARLNQDGSKDTSFLINLASGSTFVRALAFQSDGKIIVAGEFTTVNGSPVPNRIIRLNADGTLDASFNSGGVGATGGSIIAIAVDQNDKILIGGSFLGYNGVSLNRIARLNSNGTLDATFSVGSGANSTVNAIVIQPSDSKILLSGNFVNYNGVSRSRIARLNTDGTVDTSFVPAVSNSTVRAIVVQADGKIIYGGDFTNYAADPTKKYLVRVSSTGALDSSFNCFGFNGVVNALQLDSNSKLLVGGNFTTYNASSRLGSARLNSDATLDVNFNPTGANGVVISSVIQPDGKILVGGSFTTFNAVSKIRLARITGYITTKVSASQCGTTLSTIDQYVYADLIAGAQGYRFRVTKMIGALPSSNPADIQTIDTYLRLFRITQLPNYAFNTSYKVEAKVKYNGIWEPFYGSPCTVTTPIATTKIQTSQCGGSITSMADIIYANGVPFATGYRFRVINPLTSQVYILDRNLREFRMSLLTLPAATYNTSYTVEVAVRNTDGTYLPYGEACSIDTPTFPSTQIQTSQCNYSPSSNSEIIYADPLSGVTQYRFKFMKGAFEYSVERYTRTVSLDLVPGIEVGETYDVQVSVLINGIWGPYGKVCSITAPGGAKYQTSIVSGVSKEVVSEFKAIAYPNPFAENFKLQVTTDSQVAMQVRVYDMIGKLVEDRKVETTEMETVKIGASYPSGVYNIIVSQGDSIQILRVIRR